MSVSHLETIIIICKLSVSCTRARCVTRLINNKIISFVLVAHDTFSITTKFINKKRFSLFYITIVKYGFVW